MSILWFTNIFQWTDNIGITAQFNFQNGGVVEGYQVVIVDYHCDSGWYFPAYVN